MANFILVGVRATQAWFVVLGSGVVLLLICFIVEIYYASGSGISWKSTSANVHGKAYISARSWIATCVFLFVAFVCYIADLLFVTMINRQTQQTTVVGSGVRRRQEEFCCQTVLEIPYSLAYFTTLLNARKFID
uniref:Uncharacterized protein n=1 Tax=Romanomermis culicivorax TaxID=13658 RepID=A0A915L0B1_ROMCU